MVMQMNIQKRAVAEFLCCSIQYEVFDVKYLLFIANTQFLRHYVLPLVDHGVGNSSVGPKVTVVVSIDQDSGVIKLRKRKKSKRRKKKCRSSNSNHRLFYYLLCTLHLHKIHCF